MKGCLIHIQAGSNPGTVTPSFIHSTNIHSADWLWPWTTPFSSLDPCFLPGAPQVHRAYLCGSFSSPILTKFAAALRGLTQLDSNVED